MGDSIAVEILCVNRCGDIFPLFVAIGFFGSIGAKKPPLWAVRVVLLLLVAVVDACFVVDVTAG